MVESFNLKHVGMAKSKPLISKGGLISYHHSCVTTCAWAQQATAQAFVASTSENCALKDVKRKAELSCESVVKEDLSKSTPALARRPYP